MSTRWKVVAVVVTLSVLVGGVALAATDRSSSAGPAGRLGSAFGRPGSPAGALAGALAGTGSAPASAAARWRERISHVTHATVDVFVAGSNHELTLQHGVLTSVGNDGLTVKETDGTSVTIAVDANTAVRLDRQPSSMDALRTGDVVFTVQVDGHPARLVVAFDRRGLPAGTDATDAGRAIAGLLGSAA